MQKYLSLLLQISLLTLGCLLYTSKISIAQVTSDGTVNTQVNQNGNVSEITGGETRGGNLFHSFQDFSVGTGNEASFLNANDIANIFSRVTGGNISNIDGLISANGSANLFLINPAGIIFGENARLDVGGSFYGSTADSILFEDGEFSATDLTNPPVLTINAPIGLNLRDQPGDITVIGNGQDTRSTTDLIDTENALRVNSDKTFALVGGKLNLEGGTIKTAGGRIELGSLQGNQQVRLTSVNKGFGLDYAGVQNFQDIQLSKTATISN
ncbi:MAG: filamentous hemagglutinin N-terminal domain-containing protein [Waterburya sp.]